MKIVYSVFSLIKFNLKKDIEVNSFKILTNIVLKYFVCNKNCKKKFVLKQNVHYYEILAANLTHAIPSLYTLLRTDKHDSDV